MARVRGELHLRAVRADVGGVNIGRFVFNGICGERFFDFGQNAADVFAVHTQKCFAIKRHAVHEIDKGLVQPLHVLPVGVHVVFIDIGHHGDDGRQIQERRIAFIGFGDQILAFAQFGIRAGGGEFAADNEGRVHTGRTQNGSGQAGGGGFAVRTGNGDAVFQAHEFRQHHGARNHGNVLCQSSLHFGIIGLDGGGRYHHFGTFDVFRRVAGKHAHAQIAQMLGHGALALIRARHLETQIVQHFGNAAHAGTADTDKMDTFDSVFHNFVRVFQCRCKTVYFKVLYALAPCFFVHLRQILRNFKKQPAPYRCACM